MNTAPELLYADPSFLQLPARPPFMRRVVRRLCGLVYQPQVTLLLPTRLETPAKSPGADYALRSARPEDHLEWIALLNADQGFGRWDAERLRRDLMDKLLAPDSAVLMHHKDRLIGCATMCLGEYQGQAIPTGMFLILDPAYRGQFKLSNALYRATLAHAEQAGYTHTFASTFPDRFSALTLYLANEGIPVHTNLWSFMQWRGVHQRTSAIVARLRKRG